MSDKKIYEEVYMPNGIKMLRALPIAETGIAEAYATVRSSPGGVSKGDCGPFSTNLYKKLGLEEGCEDFRTACDAIGISDRRVITNRLTAITDKVRIVSGDDLVGYDIYDEPAAARADGLVTTDNTIALFNYAADCAITVCVDPVKKIVGSHHASWRGSLLGVFQNQIKAFTDLGSDPKDIIAVVFPSIGVANYEMGEEAVKTFDEAGYGEFIDHTSYDKPHADLPRMNKHILLSCGLVESNVYVMDDTDTYSNSDIWHSYRRGPIVEGKHLNGMNGYFIKLN